MPVLRLSPGDPVDRSVHCLFALASMVVFRLCSANCGCLFGGVRIECVGLSNCGEAYSGGGMSA